jgi:SAM-dependent methyltransferase
VDVRDPFNVDRAGASSAAMQGAANYFRWQLDAMSSHVGARVLEVGCGAGGFTRALLGREKVVSVDVDPALIERLRLRLAGHPGWTGLAADLTDPRFREVVAPHGCDSATALNVIEHIEDDVAALVALRAALPPGGRAAILVPAHAALYSAFDAAAGHHRRYGVDELVDKTTRAGFRVDRSFYFNAVGALGWFVNYRLLRVRRVDHTTTLQVGLFDRCVVPLARRFERRFPPPFGLSAICLATVPDT